MHQWVCRPAASLLTSFGGFTSPAQCNALLQVGNMVYGMIAETSGPFSGKDVPFAYSLASSAFVAVTIPGGATSLPTTPASSGDWTPPTMAVVGNRIMITHPGYGGGNGPFFGWIDIGGFSSATVTGSTHSNTTLDTLSVNVIQAGWQVGMTISSSAADIPAGTVIKSMSTSNLNLNTTGNTNTTNQLTGVASVTGLVPGALVTGAGIPAGTIVVSVNGGGSVTISNVATSSAVGILLNFSGGTSLVLSAAATGSNAGSTLTVAGGTTSAPLYGSGNLNANPLLFVPVAVAQFNARAYFAVGNGVAFSDAGNPTQASLATQVLTFANGIAVTGFGGLPIQQTTGGVLQSLIAFQADANIEQITGDPVTNNLSTNSIGVGVGTLAPNTICQTLLGLAFISPDGMRILGFNGTVSEPIGSDGDGVCYPFLSAINPSRMVAAFNQNVIRISVKNGSVVGQPTQEWWFDFKLKAWSGPHTFPAAQIVAYQGSPNHGFTMAATGVTGKLFLSSVTPSINDTYVENGTSLTFLYQTSLLPDTQGMNENSISESTLSAAIGRNGVWTVLAQDEQGNLLNSVTLQGVTSGDTLWGAFSWGAALWNGSSTSFFQQALNWTKALVFKQMSISISGACSLNSILGNLNLRIAELGYLTQAPYVQPQTPPIVAPSALTADDGTLLTGDDGFTILLNDS